MKFKNLNTFDLTRLFVDNFPDQGYDSPTRPAPMPGNKNLLSSIRF
jgi:hypothetical protein